MRWVWVSVATLVVIFALGFLAIGSAHRDRCIHDGNVGCSMLPWSGSSNGGWGTGNVVIP
jgi:hypothetical protein